MKNPITKEDLKEVGMLGERAMKHKIIVSIYKRKLAILDIQKTKDLKGDIATLTILIDLLDYILGDIDKIKEGI